MTRLLLAVTTAALLSATLVSSTALAQARRVPCGERAKIVMQLEQGYAEKPIAIALDSQGRILEVLAAPSGTWTMLVSTPGGMTCLVASGVGWEDLPTVAADPAT